MLNNNRLWLINNNLQLLKIIIVVYTYFQARVKQYSILHKVNGFE